MIEGGVRSIKDFFASLDFPFGVLGEEPLGPPNLFLGDEGTVDNEINGDDERKRRGDVVTIADVVVLAFSSSSSRINGDDDR